FGMPRAKRCSFIPAPFGARASTTCAKAMASSSRLAMGARKGLARRASVGPQPRPTRAVPGLNGWKTGGGVALTRRLQPRIDGLAFKVEDAEHALVNAPERFSLNEPLQTFDPQRELSEGQRSLAGEPAFAEAFKAFRQRAL